MLCMDIKPILIPAGHPNRPGDKLEPLKAIVFHYTANPNANAADNAHYFGREYVHVNGENYESDKKTKFACGSAHIIADKSSIVMAIPLNEVAWACGDKHNPGHPDFNDQQPLARDAFGYHQNHETVSVEICNNSDWDQACKNGAQWAVDFLRERSLKVDLDQSLDPQHFKGLSPGKVLLVRHFDITAKICPKPFVDDHEAWAGFARMICGML